MGFIHRAACDDELLILLVGGLIARGRCDRISLLGQNGL